MRAICLVACFLMYAGVAQAAGLPPEIVARGSLKAAVSPNYAPLDWRDPATGELTGFDHDLGNALGKQLGLKIEWVPSTFEQMIPSLETGRVDVILSAITDLPSRRGTMTFVNYYRSGPQAFVRIDRAAEFPNNAALCGKTIGASRKTNYAREVATWSQANCAANGKPDIIFAGNDGPADSRLQLKQNRIDAGLQGNETLHYMMKLEPNAYALVGEPFRQQLAGIAFPKRSEALRDAFAAALRALIADGTYHKLLDKYQLSTNAISEVTIDAGQ